MALELDIELTDSRKATMAAIPATAWFLQVVYRNAESPLHPDRFGAHLAEKNAAEQARVNDRIAGPVKSGQVPEECRSQWYAAQCEPLRE